MAENSRKIAIFLLLFVLTQTIFQALKNSVFTCPFSIVNFEVFQSFKQDKNNFLSSRL